MNRLSFVIVVGPTPPPKNGGWVQQPFLRTPADGIHHVTVLCCRLFVCVDYGGVNVFMFVLILSSSMV